jgi:hypothetical protein
MQDDSGVITERGWKRVGGGSAHGGPFARWTEAIRIRTSTSGKGDMGTTARTAGSSFTLATEVWVVARDLLMSTLE